jgi:hypothetical protein
MVVSSSEVIGSVVVAKTLGNPSSSRPMIIGFVNDSKGTETKRAACGSGVMEDIIGINFCGTVSPTRKPRQVTEIHNLILARLRKNYRKRDSWFNTFLDVKSGWENSLNCNTFCGIFKSCEIYSCIVQRLVWVLSEEILTGTRGRTSLKAVDGKEGDDGNRLVQTSIYFSIKLI